MGVRFQFSTLKEPIASDEASEQEEETNNSNLQGVGVASKLMMVTVRCLGILAAMHGLAAPVSAWAQPDQCHIYRSSGSWSSSRVIGGNSAEEVCVRMVAADYPMDAGNKRVFAEPAGVVPMAGAPGSYYCRMNRTAVRLGRPYDGFPLPEETVTIKEGLNKSTDHAAAR